MGTINTTAKRRPVPSELKEVVKKYEGPRGVGGDPTTKADYVISLLMYGRT